VSPRHGGALTGDRPLAALGWESSPMGVEKRERGEHGEPIPGLNARSWIEGEKGAGRTDGGGSLL
jgi:hypothetical protein